MKPCQHCGAAIGPAAVACERCGREQRVTVGLDAPEPTQSAAVSTPQEELSVAQDTFVRLVAVFATAAVCLAAVALGLMSPDGAFALAICVGVIFTAVAFFGV